VIQMLSREQSAAWIDGASEVVKRLGGTPSACSTMFSPNRYQLETQYGELRVDISNVFEHWAIALRFASPERSPIQCDRSGWGHWGVEMTMPMEEALAQLEAFLTKLKGEA
jgi:hypothetical protein